jgi:hypothetical protein
VSSALVAIAYSDYHFDSPLLLVDDKPTVFSDAGSWETGSRWLQSITGLPSLPQAFVIPLELAAPGWNRQDLLGYELFSVLRWTSWEHLRGRPVLLAAWQSLQAILRRKPDLLMVRPATNFTRLPEAVDGVECFFEDVAAGRIRPASIAEIEDIAGGTDQSARTVSYHDLANDYYAAYRIWKGYQSLLRQGAQSGIAEAAHEAESLSGVHFAWEDYVEEKLQSPLVRRFQASRSGLSAPRYPVIDRGLDVLTYHLQMGLPEGTRLLLVDDEFHKGSAEALLRILFRQSAFTKQLPDEWVYSEQTDRGPHDRWARFVCVRTATLARNWLAYWDQIVSDEVVGKTPWQEWLAGWDRELNPNSRRAELFEPQDVFAQNREFVLDRHSAGPRIKSTVVLLDLRLQPVQNALYSVKDFPSYGLRQAIKAEKPDLPVIMFTASRQILNFAELLDSSRDIDGWFIKEGPDIPVDEQDSNSANAVAYLLERVHLYSTLAGWYRESFGWDTDRKLAYARLFHSDKASTVFPEITRLASEMFCQIQDGRTGCNREDTRTFLSFIQERVPSSPLPIVQTLVARRVAIATLLWAADLSAGSLEWNADAFDHLLPGRPSKKNVKAVYDKLNFNQVLWMRSSGVLSQLLREEFDWLAAIQWPHQKAKAISEALLKERTLLNF